MLKRSQMAELFEKFKSSYEDFLQAFKGEKGDITVIRPLFEAALKEAEENIGVFNKIQVEYIAKASVYARSPQLFERFKSNYEDFLQALKGEKGDIIVVRPLFKAALKEAEENIGIFNKEQTEYIARASIYAHSPQSRALGRRSRSLSRSQSRHSESLESTASSSTMGDNAKGAEKDTTSDGDKRRNVILQTKRRWLELEKEKRLRKLTLEQQMAEQQRQMLEYQRKMIEQEAEWEEESLDIAMKALEMKHTAADDDEEILILSEVFMGLKEDKPCLPPPLSAFPNPLQSTLSQPSLPPPQPLLAASPTASSTPTIGSSASPVVSSASIVGSVVPPVGSSTPSGGSSTVSSALSVSHPPTAPSRTDDQLVKLLGAQKLEASKPSESERFAGDEMNYVKFYLSLKAQVLELPGVGDEERFEALRRRTKGNALALVDRHMYNKDKNAALKEALEDLKFNFGPRHGIAEEQLSKVKAGKEVHPDKIEEVRGLMWEIEEMVTYARANDDDGFLSLSATVRGIVGKRFPRAMKVKFAEATERATGRGETVDVDFVVKFVKKWFKSLQGTYGMAAYARKEEVEIPVKAPSKTGIAAVEMVSQPESHFLDPMAPSFSQTCFYCHSSHSPFECPHLMQLSVTERREVFQKGRMCYKCSSTAHGVHFCRVRVRCTVCHKNNHNALFHYDTPPAAPPHLTPSAPPLPPLPPHQPQAPSTTNARLQQFAAPNVSISAVKAKDQGCYRPIVPVKVGLGEGRYTNVYALIDTGSDQTVATAAFRDRVKLNTHMGDVTLTALEASSSGMRDKAKIDLISLSDPDYRVNGVGIVIVDSLPVEKRHIAKSSLLKGLDYLSDVELIDLPNEEVELLIGTDLSLAILPDKIIHGTFMSPSAFHTPLGWAIIGKNGENPDLSVYNAFISLSQHSPSTMDDTMKEFWRQDWLDPPSEKIGLSQEEQKALKIFEETCRLVDGRYEIGLPWRHGRDKLVSIMPSKASETTARSRAQRTKSRLSQRPEVATKVMQQLRDLVDDGVAEPIPPIELLPRQWMPSPQVEWYLPPVVVEKKGKIRHCLDARAVTKGVNLNALFLDSPDLNNPLLAILLSFMALPVVVLCDVKAFYHQVSLRKEDQDAFRFFKWTANSDDLEALRMLRFCFGSQPSSSAVIYCFRANAQRLKSHYPPKVIESVEEKFYVDDGADCAANDDKGVELALGLISLCNEGGFKVTKFVSNSPQVLAAIPSELWHPDIKSKDALPSISVLGLIYDAAKDMLHVRVPPCKAGGIKNRSDVLSTVMGLFDPTGIICPFVLLGRKLSQRLCYMGLDWSDPLPAEIAAEVVKWAQEIPLLKDIGIPRWAGLSDKDQPVTLYCFADASNLGYGAVVYVHPDDTDEINFLTAKARVSPEKQTVVDVGGSTPKLELQSGVVAIETVIYIREYVGLNISKCIYFTDSTVVYFQIQSEDKKFKVFVANRLNKIRIASSPSDWRHVPTNLNPADIVSRGALPSDPEPWRRFHKGPAFLRLPSEEWPPLPPRPSDVSIGVLVVDANSSLEVGNDLFGSLVERKSDLDSIMRIVAYVLRFVKAFCQGSGVVTRRVTSRLRQPSTSYATPR